MKLKVLLFSIVLIYCIDYIAANIENPNNNDGVVNLNDELSSQLHPLHHQASRNVRETNDRCDPSLLEKYDINTLAKAASFSDHCSDVAAEVFSRRFASDSIEISNSKPDSFEIYEYFGHLITKVLVEFDRSGEACEPNEVAKFRNLLQTINQNSSNLLTEFDIYYDSDCFVDIFHYLKGPFERVENASFVLKNIVFQTNDVRLNKIFPNVRYLSLDYDIVTDSNFVDGEYKNLNELSIGGRLMDVSEDETLTDLLEKNSHIQSITIENPTHRIFKLVKEYLTNLEELRILRSIEEDPTQEEITFESIKKLDIFSGPNNCPIPKHIKFNPNLEELHFYCTYPQIGDDYFTFLSTFLQITKLGAGSELNHPNFMKLIGLFPKLSEANFDLQNDVTADNIAEFVRKSDQLNVLKFLYFSNPNVDELAKQLGLHIGEEFKIQIDRSAPIFEFLIERKVPRNIPNDCNVKDTLLQNVEHFCNAVCTK